MARVTVEDCVVKIPNRFELVLLASQRARDLSAGAAETVERENDKNPVIALREIADETIDLEELHDALIFGLQKYVEVDEPEDDSMAIFAAAEKEWAGVTGDSPVADDAAAEDATTDDTAGEGGGEAPIGVVPSEDAMDAADAAADEASIGETPGEDAMDAADAAADEASIGETPGEDAMDAADTAADEASIGETPGEDAIAAAAEGGEDAPIVETLSEDTIDAANDSGETDTPIVVDETI